MRFHPCANRKKESMDVELFSGPACGELCAMFENFGEPTKRPASGAAKQLYDQARIYLAYRGPTTSGPLWH